MNSATNPDQHALDTLRLIGPAPDNWVPDRPGIDHNVFIVGGGQTGAAFSFALRRAGIGRVSAIDAAPDEARAGVWLNRARMNRLRTPKSLPGPEAGLPGLSFQAWHEARFGAEAYAQFDRIPRTLWAGYLAWYRRVLDIPVRYGTTLARIEPAGDHFRLHLTIRDEGGERSVVETARKIVLANGVAGNGRPNLPAVLAALPRERLAHTSDAIDFAALRGKSVAVVGGAASAFDAAATALEAGAADVHLFVRRASLPAVPVTRARAYPGAYDNYFELPDSIRWAQALRFRRSGSTPPADAVDRVTAFDNFHLHAGVQWDSAHAAGDKVEARVAGEPFAFDFVIAGTGYAIDVAARPELADFAARVLLWRDRYQPPAGDEDDALGAHPYLGAALEYVEKRPGDAPYLRDIHVYNPAGFVSFGLPVGDVPSMKRDIPAVVRRISRDLFLADLDAHEARMRADVPADFDASSYAHRLWDGERVDAA
ncbi:flavin-containing monooxygenase [Paraburkholderia caballeronis]|uniref:Predicted flavoprotein CzcO associated with the cation diffusion facilitator CzcD n=1 Tax=Paraburkholderia caballeronis TaxID=416943 RepID=A0A1H7LI03_9BURK|nr:NAD(P)/FAD-dependent oxidoreductase [Paraburkholderia caballeronis]PXW28470.1 cation diffusion facilitator CzcD-associated flavoprotein CzcO [Paraburkholderia caballeronis]PXX03836.1 cation diffusion facilitator CzcD-associated flavoprotein CzcO [Paraburkholderia caballeronis]RAK04580.1 cation diffusion facilitator CzcD-associated flavoprotein CzcO [Paraburkholderia caballeronis]SED74222.1 Predicted flavoprotein CzcO associated with the cation diffusion facilitator CzcD [Paraburkholderia cab